MKKLAFQFFFCVCVVLGMTACRSTAPAGESLAEPAASEVKTETAPVETKAEKAEVKKEETKAEEDEVIVQASSNANVADKNARIFPEYFPLIRHAVNYNKHAFPCVVWWNENAISPTLWPNPALKERTNIPTRLIVNELCYDAKAIGAAVADVGIVVIDGVMYVGTGIADGVTWIGRGLGDLGVCVVNGVWWCLYTPVHAITK